MKSFDWLNFQKFRSNDVCDIFYDLWSFCTDSLEFLKPEDAQNVRKRFFEFTFLTRSQKKR